MNARPEGGGLTDAERAAMTALHAKMQRAVTEMVATVPHSPELAGAIVGMFIGSAADMMIEEALPPCLLGDDGMRRELAGSLGSVGYSAMRDRLKLASVMLASMVPPTE